MSATRPSVPLRLLALIASLGVLLAPLRAGADSPWGEHRGYVAGRGLVMTDDGHGGKVPIWALYEPDRIVRDPASGTPYYVPGRAQTLQPATGDYRDAQVLGKAEYEVYRGYYAALLASDAGKFTLYSRSEYDRLTFHDKNLNSVLKPKLQARTTQVAVRNQDVLEPGAPLVVREFSFDPKSPAAGSNELTFLICEQPSCAGKVLLASEKVITYLADYITPIPEQQRNVFGFCFDSPDTVETIGGINYPIRDDVSRFERCDYNLIASVWAPVNNAYVDCGARWMFNGPGARTDERGYFALSYPYPPGYEFFDTLYVAMNFAPFDPRVPFGSRYFERRRVIAGATLKLNEGAINALGNSSFGFGAAFSNPSFDGTLDTNGAIGVESGVLVDTATPRSVNVSVQVAYMVGRAQLGNLVSDGLPLQVGTAFGVTIDDDSNRTNYHYVRPNYPAPTIEHKALGAGGSAPTIDRVSAVQPEGTTEVEHRGLVQSISRADLSRTDYYLFDQEGKLIATREGLRANETDGLTCDFPQSVPFGASPTCTLNPDKANGPAAFNLQDFIPNRYPGARLKIVILNRATGYLGTGVVTVGKVSDDGTPTSATSAITIAPDGGSPGELIPLYPPNITVRAERLRDGANATSDEDKKSTIAFEGAGLTSDSYIAVSVDWRAPDGSPLPPQLPGMTGRIARVAGGRLVEATSQFANGAGADGSCASGDGKACSTAIGHFAITPTRKIQYVRTRDDAKFHYYLHVDGERPDRCPDSTNSRCKDFAANEEAPGPLRYRPDHYVPLKVPVFDELATKSALLSQIALAQQRAQGATAPTVVPSVKPIYANVYRPEFQFSIYDLPTLENAQVLTQYDSATKGSVTSLSFDTELGSSEDPLAPLGSGHTLIWGMGYEQVLAIIGTDDNPHQVQHVKFDDLDKLLSLSPAAQLAQVEGAVGYLKPADYVGLELTQQNDPGNVLYDDPSLAYPLLLASAQPIELKRRENLSTFQAEIHSLPIIDDFAAVSFELTRPARVHLALMDSERTHTLGDDLVPWQELKLPGRYYFIVDSQAVHARNGEPNSYAWLEAVATDEDTPGVPHRVEYPIHVSELRSGRMLGEIVEHDVNILDGSLRLSRQDFNIPGIGPTLALSRSYSNLASDSSGILGAGWSHSYELALSVLSTDEYTTQSIPDWVAEARGGFGDAASIECRLYPSQCKPQARPSPVATAVQVNGTAFRFVDGQWRRERGRHGSLQVRTGSECPSASLSNSLASCFVYTAKDGTEYEYGVPQISPPSAGVLDPSPTRLSLSDTLAVRMGIGLQGELVLRAPNVQPGHAGSGLTPVMAQSISDRFGNRSRLHYDSEGRILEVIDATQSRRCTFDYEGFTGYDDVCATSYRASPRLRRIDCLEGNDAISVFYCYDAQGNLEKVRRGQREETYAYENSFGCHAPEAGAGNGNSASAGGCDPNEYNLISTTSAEQRTRSFHYHEPGAAIPSGVMLEPLRAHEVVESVEYPPTAARDGEHRAMARFRYQGNRRVVTELRSELLNKTYTLNSHGNPTRIEEPRGKVTQLTWSIDQTSSDPSALTDNVLVSRSVKQDDSNTQLTTTFKYDANGDVIEELGPGPRVVHQTFGDFGLLRHRDDWHGTSEDWFYDSEGFLQEHVDPAGNHTLFTRDATFKGLAATEKVLNAEPARTIKYTYDAYGNLRKSEIDGVEHSAVVQIRDTRGRVTSETDPNGNVTSYDYFPNDEIKTVTLPPLTRALPAGTGDHSTNLLSFSYDKDGNKISENDRNGLQLAYEYTGRGQIKRITRSSDGAFRDIRYDLSGNIVYETDWEGKATEYGYDDLGFRQTTKNREGDTSTTLHDLVGNVVSTTDFGGLTSIIHYDALNREVSRHLDCAGEDNCGSDVITRYEQPTSAGEAYSQTVTNAHGVTSSFGYDGRGLLVHKSEGGARDWRYHYNAYGQLDFTIDPEQGRVEREYNPRGQLVALTNKGRNGTQAGLRSEFEYDFNGNLRHERRSSGSAGGLAPRIEHIEHVYDEWNRETQRVDPELNRELFLYDGEGNLLQHLDRAGHLRSWQRDVLGRVEKFTDAETAAHLGDAPCGATLCYQYDKNGNPKRITDVRGLVTTMTYDAEGRLLATTETGGDASRSYQVLERDARGNPRRVRDYLGHERSFDYTKRGLLRTDTDALQRVESYSYTDLGNIDVVTTRGGLVRDFDYDALNRLRSVKLDGDTEATYTYNNLDQELTLTNRRHGVTRSNYDPYQRLESVEKFVGTGATVRVIKNEYDDLGAVIAATDAEQHRYQYRYDNRGLLREVISPAVAGEGEASEIRLYDPVGNLLSVTLPGGFSTAYQYDAENRVTEVRAAAGTAREEKTTRNYDLKGNLIREIKPEQQAGGRHAGESTTFSYDRFNRLERVSQAVSSGQILTTRLAHDLNDNLTEVHGPYAEDDTSAPFTSYEYDALDRPTAQHQYGDGTVYTTTFDAYDGHDNLTSATDPNGQAKTYQFDHRSRPLRATYPQPLNGRTDIFRATETTWSYDDDTGVVSITARKRSPSNSELSDVTTEQYDPVFGRLQSSNQRGTTISYDYFGTGDRKTVTSPNGTTTYTYDARNRLKSAAIGSDTTQYEYFPDGKLRRVQYGNGTQATLAYFENQRLQSIQHQLSSGKSTTIAYDYDRNGNPTKREETRSGGGNSQNTTFDQYDGLDRLLQFTRNGEVTRYTYERANRKSELVQNGSTTTKSRSYTYDRSDRLKQVADQLQSSAINYTYDPNGNTTLREVTTNPAARVEFNYDSRDQLVEVARGPPVSREIIGRFDYDADGMRVRSLASERGDVESFYDGDQLIEEHRGASEVPRNLRYHYGADLLALTSSSGSEYFHQDALGSTTDLSDSTGAQTASYQHDPWGNVLSKTGTSQNRSTFTGQRYDEKTGLYYYGARFYDPEIGRFITQDSYLGEPGNPLSLNRFAYVKSNPGRYIDPTGHEDEEGYGRSGVVLYPIAPPTTTSQPASFSNCPIRPGSPGTCVGSGTQSGELPEMVVTAKDDPQLPPSEGEMQARTLQHLLRSHATITNEFVDRYDAGPRRPPSGAPPLPAITAEHSAARIPAVPVPTAPGTSALDKALGFAAGFGGGALGGLGTAAAIGVLGAIWAPAATVAGVGLLVWGVKSLVENNFAGAKAISSAVKNVAKLDGTARDYAIVGGLLGGLATGGRFKQVSSASGAATLRAIAAAKNAFRSTPIPVFGLGAGGMGIGWIPRAARPAANAAGEAEAAAEAATSASGSTAAELAEEGATGAAEAQMPAAADGDFHGPWREPPGPGFDWNAYLRRALGEGPPESMYDPHAHHILFKKGLGRAQQALVEEGQSILRRRAGIDPIWGQENLVWAPNRVPGQHGPQALMAVVNRLRSLEGAGATPEAYIQALRELGVVAARRGKAPGAP